VSKLKLGVAREGISQTDLEVQEFTLKQLANEIKNHTPGTKFGAYFIRGESKKRKDSELKNIQLITIDGDSSLNDPHSAPDPKLAHDILQKAGYNHLIYPSFSNSKEKTRWRAILPCRNITTKEDFIKATNDITALLQENNCLINPVKENYTLSQAWFITKPKFGEFHNWFLLCDGLQDYQINGSNRQNPQTIVWDHNDVPRSGSEYDFKSITPNDAVLNIQKGIALHPSLVALAGSLSERNYNEEIIIAFLKGLLTHSKVEQERPGRLDNSDDEIDSIMKWIANKRDEKTPMCESLLFADLFDKKPKKREWLFPNILTRGTVNITSGEGSIGKSNLSLLMAISGAGGIVIEPFTPDVPLKILMINAEDSREELHRRIYALGEKITISEDQKEALSKNLHIYPARGKIGALMELNNHNPKISKYGLWLKGIIATTHPDLVFLDTKSRLYGLSENDNDHAAQWISMLESMSEEHDVGFIVLSHTGKNTTNMNNSYASRGASAISDNARSGMSLVRLSEEEIDLFNVDPHQYFKLILTKSNYSPYTGKIWYFKKEEEGIPVLVDLKGEQLDKPKTLIKACLNDNEYTLKALKNDTDGPAQILRTQLSEQCGFTRNNLLELIKQMVDDRELYIEKISGEGKRKKQVLRVSFTGEN